MVTSSKKRYKVQNRDNDTSPYLQYYNHYLQHANYKTQFTTCREQTSTLMETTINLRHS